MSATVPFRLVAGHLTVVPVTVDDRRAASFLFDTGIGVTVLDDRLRRELGHSLEPPPFVGRRMSGQALEIPLCRLDALSLGTRRLERPVAGSFDLSGFSVPEGPLDGFLSLSFFEGAPVTVDYVRGALTIEDDRSMRAREASGVSVPTEVRRDGPSVELFVDLELPGGSIARVEVDTGSDHLILHARYLPELGLGPGGPPMDVRKGTDETGRPYVRYATTLSGDVALHGHDSLRQAPPRAIFQEIIHDGLLGRDFLRAYAVTYDLAGHRLIFGAPAMR